MTYDERQALTEEQAREMAKEVLDIKGFTVYVADAGEQWNPYYLVFKNGHHIHYANEDGMYDEFYKGRGMTDADLRQKHIDALNAKLFTEEELAEPIKDYDEYERKRYFLQNYYSMQVDYVSSFRIAPTKEEEAAFQEKIKGLTFNPISFCYMADVDFIHRQSELRKILEARKEEMKDNYEYYKKAFISEMYNHEYSINWQADLDTLSAFGGVSYRKDYGSLDEMFDDCGFTETQRKAYVDAKQEYYRQIGEEDVA